MQTVSLAGLRGGQGDSSLEHLRGSWRLDVHFVTRGNEVARDHVLVALPGADHWIDAGIRVDHDLQECRSREGQELGDHARHVILALEANRIAESVRLRSLYEVLLVKRLVAG